MRSEEQNTKEKNREREAQMDELRNLRSTQVIVKKTISRRRSTRKIRRLW